MPRFLAVLAIVAVVALVVLALRPSVDDVAQAGGMPAASEAAAADVAPATTPAAASSTPAAPPESDAEPIPLLRAAPPLRNIDGWLQSDVTSLEELRGKVVIVHFWTFACRNCKATIPHLQTLYAATSRDDFEIVGIHSPEFDFEADVANIEAAAAEQGVTWPIALDTSKRTFHSWQPGRTGYWPRTMILDQAGNIRYDHIGEGAYDEIAETVAQLIANSSA